MVCEITQFGYNGATAYILIHQQLSAPIRKSNPIHSCTYDQNLRTPSTSLTPSHFYPIEAVLASSVEPAYFSASNTPHCAHICSDYAKKLFRISYPSNLSNIRTRASV